MKNRFLCAAMAVFCALGMAACGKQAEPEEFVITTENVDTYIVTLGEYEGLTVEAKKEELTDEIVEYYANFYYKEQASTVEGMTDEEGNVIPMTDDAIKMFNSEVYTTVNEFMVFVRNTVDSYLQYKYENEIVQGVVEQVTKSSEFAEKLPEGLLAKEKEYINETFSETAASYEIDTDYYLELCGTSMDELASDYAKEELVFFKIAMDQGFNTEDKEAMTNEIFDYLVDVTNVKQ